MGELLSHAECEALLATADRATSARLRTPLQVAPAQDALEDWASLNFQEPTQLPSQALDYLIAIQSGMCERLEKRIHSLLGQSVRVRPVGLNIERFDAFDAESMPCTCLFQSPTQHALPWRISWQTGLARRLFEILLGGSATELGKGANKPLTEVEHRLLSRLCSAALDVIIEVELLDSQCHSHRVLSLCDPASHSPDLAAASFLCINFEMDLTEGSGIFRCWLPVSSIPSCGNASAENGSPKWGGPPPAMPRNAMGKTATLMLVADLARLKARAEDIAELCVGDVLMTEASQLDDISLRVSNRLLFRGAVGVLDGKKSVRLSAMKN